MQSTEQWLALDGKVAAVTGGASGIGLATVRKLARHGASVVILDVNEKAGGQAAEELRSEGLAARFVGCNVTSSADCEAAVETIRREYGRLDILFNNAGVIRRRTVVEMTEEEWDAVVDISLKGAFLLSKYAVPLMAEGGGGSIINTGSGWGLKGGDRAAAYCAAKAGIVNLTKAMAIDHGGQQIRVNCVCPGDTDTPLLRDEAKQLQREEQSFVQASALERPLKRIGTPDDIANAVLFLASDMSSWVTGSVLVVDGGGLA
ncbi:NAD(P)-dependent dehydrogenase, short-chain alcohol dehydrogenase family [Paenibacillus tianmuensis]|uniref:NAD(P)-dependent dehydrogenase, short-chain alcohol dehydrogenase family n=1 Tax=Paenibacillus tianmuensis TaxID=624147 RepID=A0A1G4P432_9BACL|nr:SDR family NAD(P)-dependent oxidoreductase [Paenibacillus tianmuensis]SCW27005.1 NAD(P)-dependent dehydrogenase, short-chain alcohol dehydrogenase family [Paenibacillus tianmuensis]